MNLLTFEGASEFVNNFNNLRIPPIVPPIPDPIPSKKAELKKYYNEGKLTKEELIMLGGSYETNPNPNDFNEDEYPVLNGDCEKDFTRAEADANDLRLDTWKEDGKPY